mmetsp:Transcript_31660/g.57334  ORF Transcript_31660/g.57334 Transcript_31660/m.57334 type:complete len:139 (-) Transcript_31660:120-536(-)
MRKVEERDGKRRRFDDPCGGGGRGLIITNYEQTAVYNGNTRVLQWMMDYHSCVPGKDKLAVAGERGHVNVLEWAEANNLAWMSQDLCFAASSNGHVHILKWIHQHCPEEMTDWRQFVARSTARCTQRARFYSAVVTWS